MSSKSKAASTPTNGTPKAKRVNKRVDPNAPRCAHCHQLLKTKMAQPMTPEREERLRKNIERLTKAKEKAYRLLVKNLTLLGMPVESVVDVSKEEPIEKTAS
jgi:hypothetical protein